MKSVMRHLTNVFLFLLPPTRCFGLKRMMIRLAGIDVADNVHINGMTVFFGSGKVTIGDGTWVGLQNKFYSNVLADIHIGAHCDIGPSVSFIPGSHDIGPPARRAGAGIAGDIIVEDGCWIGVGVTILGDVRIGHGAVIGAGSLVNKDIPANCLYAGIPARLIRELSDDG